jgi:hypothetical protein
MMDFPRVAKLFAEAMGRGMKQPSVRLPGGVAFKVTRQTRKLILCVGADWVATIQPDGRTFWKMTVNDSAVRDELREFEADPAGRANVVGLSTNHCCFCGIELTAAESVGNGYGPICAEHWGLPWAGTPAAMLECAKRLKMRLDEAQRLVNQ